MAENQAMTSARDLLRLQTGSTCMLVGGLVLAPIPSLWIDPGGREVASLLGAAVALLFAHVVILRLAIMPLTTAPRLVVPVFATTGLGVLALFGLSRIDHSIAAISSGAALAAFWYLAIHLLGRRKAPAMIALIGDPGRLPAQMPGWTESYRLDRPRLDRPTDAVIFDPAAAEAAEWTSFLVYLAGQGMPVMSTGRFNEEFYGRLVEQKSFPSGHSRLARPRIYAPIKRAFDLVLAIMVLPPVVMVILIAALAIRIDTPGSPFFIQPRQGRYGRTFACFKLRTMHAYAEGPEFTLVGDPRITRVGGYLRKWHIDELAQLLNVILGQMSLIGPRPEFVILAERYAQVLRCYEIRHLVRPGITGWAAVHQGNVGDVAAANEKLEYDAYYIKHMSVWLDFLIVLKTIRAIWMGVSPR